MKNERLMAVKKIIEIEKHKSGHLMIKSKFKKHRFKKLTNIHSNLTTFELNCVYIYVYKTISKMSVPYGTRAISYEIGSLNYADVFGSPWDL